MARRQPKPEPRYEQAQPAPADPLRATIDEWTEIEARRKAWTGRVLDCKARAYGPEVAPEHPWRNGGAPDGDE